MLNQAETLGLPLELDRAVLHKRIHSALRSWQKVSQNSGDMLEDLLLFQDVVDSGNHPSGTAIPRSVTNLILSDALQSLARQHASFAQLLRLRFVESNSLGQTADSMGWTIDQVRHNQRQAVEELTAIVAHDEGVRRISRAHEILSLLPPSTYTQLFGCDDVVDVLEEHVLSTDSSFVVAVTGIGGIGKTAIADCVVRRVVSHFRFRQFVWIRADPLSLDRDVLDYETAIDLFANEIALKIAPEVAGNASKEARLSRVRQVLKEAPHLIIIDNLETISNTAFLMRQLQDWANPSKFLLTTRIRPTGEASVFSHGAEELDELDSAELLRHHAMAIGQPDLAAATPAQAKMVYDVVGGNPLAIKLVVGLANTMPITLVLNDLQHGHTSEIEGMYKRIYQRIWQSLTHVQRTLLRALPLVSENGGTVEQLRTISGFDDADLWPAVNELVNRSLLELLGTTWDRRYGIHRLTSSFLQTDINRWDDQDMDVDEELEL